jgi:hypothetical protein
MALKRHEVVMFVGRFWNDSLDDALEPAGLAPPARSVLLRRPVAVDDALEPAGLAPCHVITRCCPGVTRSVCERCHCRRPRRLQRRCVVAGKSLTPRPLDRYERCPKESQQLSARRVGEGSVRPTSARQAQDWPYGIKPLEDSPFLPLLLLALRSGSGATVTNFCVRQGLRSSGAQNHHHGL